MVVQLLHHNGLLLLLIACLEGNPVPDTSKLGKICNDSGVIKFFYCCAIDLAQRFSN